MNRTALAWCPGTCLCTKAVCATLPKMDVGSATRVKQGMMDSTAVLILWPTSWTCCPAGRRLWMTGSTFLSRARTMYTEVLQQN